MDFSLLGLWSQMGAVAKTVVVLLIGMSMYAIGIALERFVTFRRGRRRSLEYIAALQPLMGSGDRLQEASALQANWKDAPLARIIGTGLNEFHQGLKELGASASDAVELELLVHGVGRSMERAKKREMAGLITAFQNMADPSKGGGGGLATVSAGISEALLTTAVGLAVAIGAVWFYNFFTTRLEDIGNLIDDATGELADRLLHGSRRAGRAQPSEAVPRPVSA
jgi:biopolymer transport protein ExbB